MRTAPLLAEPWILDIDTTVKPLYGHQEGAVVGYNPKKPGRPSHSYHTYSMAGARLVFDVVLAAIDLTRDELMAETLAWKLDEVERIDRMVAGAEARRNVALREIDRHRATLAATLRQAVDEALDAEFKEIPPRLTEGEAA